MQASRRDRHKGWPTDTRLDDMDDAIDLLDDRLQRQWKVLTWFLTTAALALLSLTGSLVILVLKG